MNQLSFIQKIKNKIKVAGKNNKILIEGSIKISKTNIVIKGNNNTLHVKDGAKINGSFLEIVGDNCSIIIGKNSIIGDGCYLSAKEENITLTIGNECMLSRNAKLMTSDGHPIFQEGKIINCAKDIALGDKVWIADNVVVLKGVEIGNGCVIGIGSVLTKSIPGNSIAAGNPAKVIKENINWNH